jgi:hypothetical protein
MQRKKIFLVIIIFSISILFCTRTSDKSEYSDYFKVELPDNISEENTILTITGKLDSEGPLALNLDTIMSFPETSFTSIDPWDNIEHQFTGVLIYPILKRSGISDTAEEVDISAENDYKATITLDDIKNYEYILAYKMDGEILHNNPAFRARGSIMIAVNFNKYQELDTEVYKFHLVWQVKDIYIY